MRGDREKAPFNLALPYLFRVNNVLTNNYAAFRLGDSRAFVINLRQLYRELYPWLSVGKTKEDASAKKQIEQGFNELAKIPKSDIDEIWSKMEDIENMIRVQFKELGMLMPKMQDPRFLFGKKQQ